MYFISYNNILIDILYMFGVFNIYYFICRNKRVVDYAQFQESDDAGELVYH